MKGPAAVSNTTRKFCGHADDQTKQRTGRDRRGYRSPGHIVTQSPTPASTPTQRQVEDREVCPPPGAWMPSQLTPTSARSEAWNKGVLDGLKHHTSVFDLEPYFHPIAPHRTKSHCTTCSGSKGVLCVCTYMYKAYTHVHTRTQAYTRVHTHTDAQTIGKVLSIFHIRILNDKNIFTWLNYHYSWRCIIDPKI